MNQPTNHPIWRSRMLDRSSPWNTGPIRPSDIGEGLCKIALARENLLEDAEYHKVAPNLFMVEVSQENFQSNYLPLQDQILGQWKDMLLNYLMTTNNRQGRNEYRYAGAVRVEIRPVQGLKPGQAHILYSIQASETGQFSAEAGMPFACIQSADRSKVWPLRKRIVTIGRDVVCDICLDSPEVQRVKLVSGQHAYILYHEGAWRLFDGSPSGKPSRNGTYVNFVRIPKTGMLLNEGDQILLAATDPNRPDPQTSGVAVLWFHLNHR